MDRWLMLWLTYGVLGLAIEAVALRNHRAGDTLSEQVWRWVGLGRPPTGWVRARRVLFLAGWSWLTLHFILHWA